MRIISLVENTGNDGVHVEHGLSLYIRLDDGRSVLFDMGQGSLFAENAERCGCDLSIVETAVISHGHYDHGGGLDTFLNINEKARVYLHRDAFQPHFSLRDDGMHYIGLDTALEDNGRIVRCGDITNISDGMLLFAGVKGNVCCPVGNRRLFGPSATVNDDFRHEQNLIIREKGNVVLFAGCAHCGIVNIIRSSMELTGVVPTHVLAGMHLMKSGLAPDEETEFIGRLASELAKFDGCRFVTMHCTGEGQYKCLRSLLPDRIDYLSCCDTIVI